MQMRSNLNRVAIGSIAALAFGLLSAALPASAAIRHGGGGGFHGGFHAVAPKGVGAFHGGRAWAGHWRGRNFGYGYGGGPYWSGDSCWSPYYGHYTCGTPLGLFPFYGLY
jgi:hypothetical protein